MTPAAPAEPDAQLKSTEEELWRKLLEDVDDEKRHREYVGFVLRNNLVKIGLRHYGEIVEAKDRYSIEARRLAKRYQKSLMDILFFTPRREERTKTSSLELLGIIIIALAMVTGFYMFTVKNDAVPPVVMLILRLLCPAGLIALIVLIRRKVLKARAMMNRPGER